MDTNNRLRGKSNIAKKKQNVYIQMHKCTAI